MFTRTVKTILSFLLGISLICPYGQVALAEESDTPEIEEEVNRYGMNTLMAMCAGTISPTNEILTCNLTSNTFQATVFATIAYDSSVDPTSIVDCYVILPSGTSYFLGAIPATGGQSTSVNFYLLFSGEYKFYFESSTSEPLEAAGYIYI